MERYNNGRTVVRHGGRFAKQPTLEQMGYPVAKGTMTCVCGHEWMPVLTTGYCPKCGSQDKAPNKKRALTRGHEKGLNGRSRRGTVMRKCCAPR